MRIGRRRISERTRSLAGQLKQGLAANPRVRLRTPHDDARLPGSSASSCATSGHATPSRAYAQSTTSFSASRPTEPSTCVPRASSTRRRRSIVSSPRSIPSEARASQRTWSAGWAAIVAAVALLAGCGGGDQDAGWEQAPALAHGRSAHAIASDGAAVWALGGTDAAGLPVLAVERLDGDGWEDVATLPGEGLNAPAAVCPRWPHLCDRRLRHHDERRHGSGSRLRRQGWKLERGGAACRGPRRPRRRRRRRQDPRRRRRQLGLDTRPPLPSTTLPRTAGVRRLRCRTEGQPAAGVVHEDGRLWVIGGRSGSDDFGGSTSTTPRRTRGRPDRRSRRGGRTAPSSGRHDPRRRRRVAGEREGAGGGDAAGGRRMDARGAASRASGLRSSGRRRWRGARCGRERRGGLEPRLAGQRHGIQVDPP